MPKKFCAKRNASKFKKMFNSTASSKQNFCSVYVLDTNGIHCYGSRLVHKIKIAGKSSAYEKL